MTRKLLRFRKVPTFKLGDFVCCNGPNLHDYNMKDELWQAVGVIEKVYNEDNPRNNRYEICFPAKRVYAFETRMKLSALSFRKATRSEGEAAFFDPEYENMMFDKRNKRLEAASKSAAVAALKVEDF